MLSFVDMRRRELSIDGETKCRYMKDDREQEEKAGQHGGQGGEQCATMVTGESQTAVAVWDWRLEEDGEARKRRQCILRNMPTQINAVGSVLYPTQPCVRWGSSSLSLPCTLPLPLLFPFAVSAQILATSPNAAISPASLSKMVVT